MDASSCNGPVVKALDSQSRSLSSKPLGGSKINSAFHLVKSKLYPRIGSVALRQLNPIHKKEP